MYGTWVLDNGAPSTSLPTGEMKQPTLHYVHTGFTAQEGKIPKEAGLIAIRNTLCPVRQGYG